MPSAGITWVDRARVLADARQLARRMRQAHDEIDRVVLIGSFARGAGGPRSDLDIVVLVRGCSLAPRDRVAHYLPVHPRAVDLTVCTLDEVAAMQGSPPPILAAALERGIDL